MKERNLHCNSHACCSLCIKLTQDYHWVLHAAAVQCIFSMPVGISFASPYNRRLSRPACSTHVTAANESDVFVLRCYRQVHATSIVCLHPQVEGVGLGAVAAASKHGKFDLDKLATWKAGQPVPFAFLADTFEAIAEESKRLVITSLLVWPLQLLCFNS